jgi:hypothetical protein
MNSWNGIDMEMLWNRLVKRKKRMKVIEWYSVHTINIDLLDLHPLPNAQILISTIIRRPPRRQNLIPMFEVIPIPYGPNPLGAGVGVNERNNVKTASKSLVVPNDLSSVMESSYVKRTGRNFTYRVVGGVICPLRRVRSRARMGSWRGNGIKGALAVPSVASLSRGIVSMFWQGNHGVNTTTTRKSEFGPDFHLVYLSHTLLEWDIGQWLTNSGTLCAASSCRQPIEGPCLLIQDLKQRYHPGHLTCDTRNCRDRMDEYYEIAGKRYCDHHAKGVLSAPGLLGSGMGRAEKRITRLVDLPAGGAFGF